MILKNTQDHIFDEYKTEYLKHIYQTSAFLNIRKKNIKILKTLVILNFAFLVLSMSVEK